MWQLSDSFSDEKNHKAVSHPAVLLMPIKLNYPLLALVVVPLNMNQSSRDTILV